MRKRGKLRVFVIDDEECIRDSIRWHLEAQGHEVFTAERPTNCAIYQGHDCQNDYPCGHALLIDYFLPEMTAFEFIQRMQSRGCKGMTRNKFVLSGDTTKINHQTAKALGCRIIQKPIRLGEIDLILKRVALRVNLDEKLAKL